MERRYSEPPNCARSSSVNSVVRLLLPGAVMLYSCELHVLHNCHRYRGCRPGGGRLL